MENLVSCILATRNRPNFMRQAIRCFQRQSYAHAELIVVDDGETSVGELCAGLSDVHYIRLDKPSTLGRKLNLGVEQSHGSIIQKLDDDDYYHPEFLKRAVSSLPTTDRAQTLVAWDCFLVLLAGETQLLFSGHGWSAGATLCFHRELWERTPFREVSRAVDWWLIKDHQPRVVKVCAPELFIVVRHGDNTWRNLHGGKVDDYFRRRPVYHKPLEELIEPPDCIFYRSLIEGTEIWSKR
ncbi:MAG: glycosyltransferase family 2 protein [Bdellovibrio sp.]|nr:glycosyltransferase family 2 protein [Bdellovibrio sp.]